MAVEPARVVARGQRSVSPSRSHAISIDRVSKTFVTRAGAPVEALRNVDVQIKAGEFVSLVGRSGCGKSTLLNIVAGLMEPSQGSITVGGEAISGPRADIGYMQQDAVMLPWRTVMENIKLPMEVGDPVPNKEHVLERIHEMLDTVHLGSFRDSHPWELSGGMQQRAALVRTLAYEPRVLLMDEPFGSLDEFTREAMNIELLRLWQGSGITVILVTHSALEAVFLSDRVVTLSPRPGQILEDVRVELPRPRLSEMLFSPELTEHVKRVRDVLGLEKPEEHR